MTTTAIDITAKLIPVYASQREDIRMSKLVAFSTDDPGQLRVLMGLLNEMMTLEAISATANYPNGAAVVKQLRRRGLELPCMRSFSSEDGREYRLGASYYSLTLLDRSKVADVLAMYMRTVMAVLD